MKNKKLKYFLVPVTLLIWGIVIYKIFSAASGDGDVPLIINETEATPKSDLIPDTFSLIAGYRDPFLGKMEERKAPASNHVPAPLLEKEEKIMVWPNLIYGGMIKNQNSNKKLALVNINGQDNIMQAGEVKEGIKLLVIYPDSVAVLMGKERKIVFKKK